MAACAAQWPCSVKPAISLSKQKITQRAAVKGGRERGEQQGTQMGNKEETGEETYCFVHSLPPSIPDTADSFQTLNYRKGLPMTFCPPSVQTPRTLQQNS